jgi:GTP cyclohydrolase I
MKKAEYNKIDYQLRRHIAECLKLLGYDLRDDNFKDTPKRMAKIWMEELHIDQPATKKLFSVFDEPFDQMVTLIGHKTWTRCPHHFERVLMEVSIGYVPDGKVLGLSKLARIADYYAKGLVLQERYVENVVNGLMESLAPKGVGIHVKGQHLCMQARGVETVGHIVTTALRGVFMERPETQREFIQYVLHNERSK